jgi:hypothetical protein
MHHLGLRSALALALAAASAGCSGGGGQEQIDAGGGGPACTPGASFDLNGRTGVLATLNVHVNASGLVETDTTAQLLLLLDIVQTGRQVAVTAQLCDLKIPDVPISGQDQPLHFEPGPGLIASVASVAGTGTLDGDTTCSTFSSDPITVLIGARMSPPDQGLLPSADASGKYTECLPAGADCATAITNNCACDQEQDAKPGATLIAQNVPAVDIHEVYVDLRTSFSLAGQVFSSDEILGNITASLEQGILACSKSTGAACSSAEIGAVKKLNPVITQNADPSTFVSLRVDPQMDCATLIMMEGVLFPQ